MTYIQVLILLLALGATQVAAAAPTNKKAPTTNPAWDSDVVRPSRMAALPPKPRPFALGVSGQVPEFGAIDAYWRPIRFMMVRGFFMPPVRFNVRVELPEDQLGAKAGIVVENPAVDVNFKAVYGPSYGVELMFFPLPMGLYVGGGVSHRKLTLKGGGQTPLNIRSELGGNAITTRTEFGLSADAETTSWLARGNLGWFWQTTSGVYVNLGAGIAKPFGSKKSIDVRGIVDSPSGSSADVQGALAIFKDSKADELESKALAEMQPAIEKTLPIATLGLGYFF